MICNIGIDAGGTFTKIAYEENSRLHFKSFLSNNLKETSKWINLLFPNAKKIVTGGKADLLKMELNNEVEIISEFDAALKGVNYLMRDEFLQTLPEYLIVLIGTGTSILIVKHRQQSRITGSGIGGGTFLGLGSLLTGINEFERLVELAHQGNRKSIDLMVADIYDPSISPIPGDLTAANFAKANQMKDPNHSDVMASLVNMIAETICLLVLQIAHEQKIQHVVCIGGALSENPPLQSTLENNFQLISLKSYFPRYGQFAGSIGALYNNVEGI